MNTKSAVKTIFALLLFTVIFLAGFYASAVYQLTKSLNTPHIESETNARNWIRASIPLPEDATRLYYAHRGFLDPNLYIAFSLSSSEECEQFIMKELGLKLEDFEEITELPDFFTEFGPDTWPSEYHDPLWDISDVDKLLLCSTTLLIVYAPERNRFYYHR
ncbi:MAG: hypothetical protein ACYTEN_04760 [Planctomycetota bacterium]|jgi:hypothetical protein